MSLPDLQEPLTLLEQKNLDAAIEVLQHKVNELPAHLVAHILLARAYEARREWEQALTAWEQAYVLMPNSPVVAEGKQRVLHRMDGTDDPSGHSMVAAEPDLDPPPIDPADVVPSAPDADDDETAPTTDEDSPDSPDPSDALSRLREHAEREARKDRSRTDLSDEGPASDSSEERDFSTTPEEQIEKLEAESWTDELDRLIDELESARIEPDPDVRDVPPPNLEASTGEVVSETLAQIHENQSNFEEAARIYSKLATQDSTRSGEFQEKAEEMRDRADRANQE